MGLLNKRFILFFFLLHFVVDIRADFHYFLNHQDQKAYRINTVSKFLEKYNNQGKWLPMRLIQFDSSTSAGFPKNIEVNHIQSLDQNKFYFNADCTNQIFVLDLKLMVFKRLDKTFYRGDNCHSYRFFRNGVPHSVGGYGFWRTNNHIIYFDEKRKEWEAYTSTGIPPLAINGGFVAYLPDKDELITFNNLPSDVNINGGSVHRDRTIYSFSFKNKKWSTIGTVSSKKFIDLLEGTGQNFRDHNYFTGKFLLLGKDNSSNAYYAINARTLEMFKFADQNMQLSKFFIGSSDNQFPTLHNFEFILNIRQKTSENLSTEEFQLENFDVLFSNSTSIGFIYENEWFISEIFFGFIFLIFILILFWFIVKKGKLIFFKRFSYSNELEFSNKLVDESTIRLLKRLIETFSTGGIDVDETNTILSLSVLAHDAQRYKRSAIVKEANTKLAFMTNCPDSIQRQDSVLDRRQKKYMINPLAINALREFLKH